jgi:hypothetical protein
MTQSRPPLSGKTRLYGLFADPVEHLQAPTVLNVSAPVRKSANIAGLKISHYL